MLAQLLWSGIAQGSIYALVALGMTVLFRATTVVNFGHGELFMVGAFAVYVLLVVLGIPYPVAAIVTAVMMFGLGMVVERLLMRPLSKAPHISLAMMTVAVSYFLRGAVRFFYGREVMSMPPMFTAPPIEVGNVVITVQDLLVTAVTLVLVAIFFAVMHFSRVGRVAQAASQSVRGAALVGINVPRFQAVMWGVATLIAAVAGLLVAPVTLLYPDMGAQELIHAFAAMTLGGFGSLGGAVAGGLLMGVIEQLAGGYVSTSLIDVSAYIVIIAVLLCRPSGLFGRPEVTRV